MKPLFLTPRFAIVIPAQAGIQCPWATSLDPRLRGDDGGGAVVAPGFHAIRMARRAMDH